MEVSVNGGSGAQRREVAAKRYGNTHFASLGEQAQAVAYALMHRAFDERLRIVARPSGSNEAIGAEGGFLVERAHSAEPFERMYTQGQILSRVSRQPVGAQFDGLITPMIDETSRADRSRFGGILGYWSDEAEVLTASKPKFELMNLRLLKLTGPCYATEELLADSVGLEGQIRRCVPQELIFKLEDAVLRGLGVARPLGILSSTAKISITKESGQAAASIVYQNIVNMYSRMYGASLPNSGWLINQNILPQLMTMSMAVGTAE